MNLKGNELSLKNSSSQNKMTKLLFFCIINKKQENNGNALYMKGKKGVNCEGCFLLFVKLSRSRPAV